MIQLGSRLLGLSLSLTRRAYVILMRAILILTLAAAAIAAPALASTVSTTGTVVIAEPASIQILGNIVLPTVISAVSVSGGGSTSVSGAPLSNAALTIRGQTGDTLSMALPASFEVIRSGGTEGLTVQTTTDANLRLSQEGVVLGGNAFADGTMSIKVGGLVALASSANVAPGPYEGTLLVLVQYN